MIYEHELITRLFNKKEPACNFSRAEYHGDYLRYFNEFGDSISYFLDLKLFTSPWKYGNFLHYCYILDLDRKYDDEHVVLIYFENKYYVLKKIEKISMTTGHRGTNREYYADIYITNLLDEEEIESPWNGQTKMYPKEYKIKTADAFRRKMKKMDIIPFTPGDII